MFQPRPLRFCLPWPALAVGLLLLAGCQPPAGPGVPATRVFAADFAGAAKSCITPKPTLKDREVTEVPLKMGNDQGWCGITVAQASARPFDAGLLVKRPAHGKVFIHSVGDATRIDYTPNRGFVGSDSFTVRLIPGNADLTAQVTVAP